MYFVLWGEKMKSIIKWAKRPQNMNFLIFTAMALILIFFALYWNNTLNRLDSGMEETAGWIDKAMEDGVDDVEGYGIIFASAGYALGATGIVLMMVLMVFFPLIFAVPILIHAILLRLIYKSDSKGRILCYRIFMGIGCALIVFAFAFFVQILAAIKLLTAILFSVVIIGGVIVCIVNTFSKRIYDKEKLCIS